MGEKQDGGEGVGLREAEEQAKGRNAMFWLGESAGRELVLSLSDLPPRDNLGLGSNGVRSPDPSEANPPGV